MLSKDTTVCISLAGRPSNIGTRFHNFLYDELELDFVYKAFTTTDIEGAIRGVRALGIRGCSVSMPFKAAVLPLVDELETSAAAIGAVNTVVNDDGRLTASNTDYEAVAALVAARRPDLDAGVLVRGAGGMARAVVAALRDAGAPRITVWARDQSAGHGLAAAYDAEHVSTDPPPAGLLVNCTPLGMLGPDAYTSAFSDEQLAAATGVIDVVAFPGETPLVRDARERGLTLITGADIIADQAARQFERYTGVRPTPDQVERAAAYSRT